MDILLTNDDGYESPGLHAIADALDGVGDVTIVAPEDDQSSIGRVRSSTVRIRERANGFSVAGTPVDCVIAGVHELVPEPAIVVAGCNVGGNLGEQTLGRSGTISAAVEASLFNIPSIALSLYIPGEQWPLEPRRSHFAEAARAITYLVPPYLAHGQLDRGCYLNVNVPFSASSPRMRLTRPSPRHEFQVERDGNGLNLIDNSWDAMDQKIPDSPDTDRSAVLNGEISISPLIAPHACDLSGRLATLVADYPHVDSNR